MKTSCGISSSINSSNSDHRKPGCISSTAHRTIILIITIPQPSTLAWDTQEVKHCITSNKYNLKEVRERAKPNAKTKVFRGRERLKVLFLYIQGRKLK